MRMNRLFVALAVAAGLWACGPIEPSEGEQGLPEGAEPVHHSLRDRLSSAEPRVRLVPFDTHGTLEVRRMSASTFEVLELRGVQGVSDVTLTRGAGVDTLELRHLTIRLDDVTLTPEQLPPSGLT